MGRPVAMMTASFSSAVELPVVRLASVRHGLIVAIKVLLGLELGVKSKTWLLAPMITRSPLNVNNDDDNNENDRMTPGSDRQRFVARRHCSKQIFN